MSDCINDCVALLKQGKIKFGDIKIKELDLWTIAVLNVVDGHHFDEIMIGDHRSYSPSKWYCFKLCNAHKFRYLFVDVANNCFKLIDDSLNVVDGFDAYTDFHLERFNAPGKKSKTKIANGVSDNLQTMYAQ